MTTPSKTGTTPPKERPGRRDATRQSVEPAGAPPTEERSYEDGQDAAFDPRGDRADKPDKPEAGRG